MYSYFSSNNLPTSLNVSALSELQLRTFCRNYSSKNLATKGLYMNMILPKSKPKDSNTSVLLIIYERKSGIQVYRESMCADILLEQLCDRVDEALIKSALTQKIAHKLSKLGFIGISSTFKKYINLNLRTINTSILLDCKSYLGLSEEEVYERIVITVKSRLRSVTPQLLKESEYVIFNNTKYLVLSPVHSAQLVINCDKHMLLPTTCNEYTDVLAKFFLLKEVI